MYSNGGDYVGRSEVSSLNDKAGCVDGRYLQRAPGTRERRTRRNIRQRRSREGSTRRARTSSRNQTGIAYALFLSALYSGATDPGHVQSMSKTKGWATEEERNGRCQDWSCGVGVVKQDQVPGGGCKVTKNWKEGRITLSFVSAAKLVAGGG